MRDGVKSDLMRIDGRLGVQLSGVPGAVFTGPFAGLFGEFFDSLCAGAGNGLVAAGDDALHAKGLMQRIERHEGNGSGAVGISDDALMAFYIGCIDFRHHERDRWVLAEEGGIIHHHGTSFYRMGGEITRDTTTCTEESDVHASKAVGREFLDGDIFTFELHRLSGTACTGEKGELADGESSLFEAAQHFHSHRSGGTDDGDVFQVTHGCIGS